MKDALGDRMKANYEGRTKQFLMRRNYAIIRIDGKAFHTFTRHLERPFDRNLMHVMDRTAADVCKEIQGAKFAFVQSDEISILLTDFDTLETQAWFDYNVQKMVSISASVATAHFNKHMLVHKFQRGILNNELDCYTITGDNFMNNPLAYFDSRVFQVPNKSEAENYFVWRQQDTTRNSIQSVAQSLYSHRELEGKNTSELQEMIFQKGTNWNDYEPYFKRGRIVVKEQYTTDVYELEDGTNVPQLRTEPNIRTRWVMKEVPIFTQEREFLSNLIPENL